MIELRMDDGARIVVATDGRADGPPVLMLHGALAAHQAFRSQLVALRGDFRLAMPDLRGHGASSHLGAEASWETFSIPRLAQDSIAIMDAISPDAPVHLVGVSMGGLTAAWAAALRPERVASLALLSTSATGSPKRRRYFAEMSPESLPKGTQILSSKWHGEPYWRTLARGLFAHFASQTGEAYPQRLVAPRALVMQATHDEILEPSEAEAWVDRIDAPTVLVRPPGDHAFFADGRAGSRAANAALWAHLTQGT